VSTSALAVPVAECGGIGTIGGSGIPVPELQEDIRKAKKATRGVVAVNIMYAMKDFYDLVMGSIEAGADMIITGAGFSRDIFKIGKEHNIPIVSIVSSPAFATLAEKLGAAAVIVEATEAGGHLGTDKPLRELFPTIRKVISKIPLIAAGGITDGYEMAEMMDKYGADGVQIAFVDKMLRGDDIKADTCRFKCLKKCNYKYCISDRLNASCTGDVDNGLVFAGANAFKMKEILSVREIFERFVKAAESVYKENVPGIRAAEPVAS
jgi:NAD(P)H-dependent flavin oxidoreductase YrpB (nitropropane dioxygenase family)